MGEVRAPEQVGDATYFLGLGGEMPNEATRTAFAGVGMIRGEYVLRACRHYFGTSVAEEALSSYLDAVASAFSPRPVWYRTADFESREINVLEGADAVVWDENPLLGARGIRRAMTYPRAFDHELSIVTEVAASHANLRVLFSYVGSPQEVDFAIARARRQGYEGEIGVMMEIPAALIDADAILARDVCHATLGLNDLRSLMYGTSRSSPIAAGFPNALESVVGRLLDAAERRACTVHAAGYLTASDVGWLVGAGVSGVVVHHHLIPELMSSRLRALDDYTSVFSTIKRWTDEAVTEAECRARCGGAVDGGARARA